MPVKAQQTPRPRVARFLPVLQWLPRYERSWLSRDAIASVSIWAVLVPQALAYFFADAERFKETVYDMIEAASEPPEAIALDADSISLTDTDGADALIDLATELHDMRSVSFAVARVQPPVWQLWERAGLASVMFDGRCFDTVHAAVNALDGSASKQPHAIPDAEKTT